MLRIKSISVEVEAIPKSQFRVRVKHSTTEWVHRIVKKVGAGIDVVGYCTI